MPELPRFLFHTMSDSPHHSDTPRHAQPPGYLSSSSHHHHHHIIIIIIVVVAAVVIIIRPNKLGEVIEIEILDVELAVLGDGAQDARLVLEQRAQLLQPPAHLRQLAA